MNVLYFKNIIWVSFENIKFDMRKLNN